MTIFISGIFFKGCTDCTVYLHSHLEMTENIIIHIILTASSPGLLLLDVLKWPGGLGTFTNVIMYYLFVRLFDWLIVWLIDYSYLKKKRILWKFICAQFFLPKEIDTQIFISSLEMTSAIYNKTTTTTTRCQNWNYIIICRFSGKILESKCCTLYFICQTYNCVKSKKKNICILYMFTIYV